MYLYLDSNLRSKRRYFFGGIAFLRCALSVFILSGGQHLPYLLTVALIRLKDGF